MNLIKLISLMAVFIFSLSSMSGCFDDSFVDALNEEEDFIAPFDIVLSDNDTILKTTYFALPPLNTAGNYTVNSDTVPGSAVDGEDNVVVDNTTGLMWTRCSPYQTSDPDGISNNGDETYEMDRSADCTDETPSKMSWRNAVKFCKETMNSLDSASGIGTGYGGHNDWTVPKAPEFVSIINFNADPSEPQVDGTAFPNSINVTDDGYWTFTSKLFIGEYYETFDYAWIVFLKHGTAFQAVSFTNSTDYRRKYKDDLTPEQQYVRCVRGGVEDPF